MLAQHYGISCSKRCETAVALAWLLSPEGAVEIIRALLQGRDRPADALLALLYGSEPQRARKLCEQTLRSVKYPLAADE